MSPTGLSVNCVQIKFRELSYLVSGIYNLFFFSNILHKISIFKTRQGKNLFFCQSFQNIWIIEWFNVKLIGRTFFSTCTKVLKSKKKSSLGDFLEIWEYSYRNKIKRKGLFYFPSVGEIWDLKWIGSRKKDDKFGCLVICYGFKLFLISVPNLISQFTRVLRISYCISLVNIYQWKMCCGCFNAITGDLRGNIIIYNLFDNFSWTRIFHNPNKNTPISILRIFLHDDINQKVRFLISGGYDGIMKIWDLEELTIPLIEICFPKRWIIDIRIYSQFIGNNILLISFDNGFLSFLCILTKELINVNFGHQISTWYSIVNSDTLISVGEDGNINVIELNAPFQAGIMALILLESSKCFFKGPLSIKSISRCLQSVDKHFSLKTIAKSSFIEGNIILAIGGSSGILIFYSFIS
nr:hypothetical protein 1634Bnrm2_p121 [Cryptomonas sp.]